jgi:arylsulfatase A-like enzyme
MFPTLAELVKGETPTDLDGISILPTLLGKDTVGREQELREMLYWEFGGQVAVRNGNWKAIRPGKNRPWALHDLTNDVSETTDVSTANRPILDRMIAFADSSHTDAKPGSYTTRDRHQKDRKAKWGTAKPTTPNR